MLINWNSHSPSSAHHNQLPVGEGVHESAGCVHGGQAAGPHHDYPVRTVLHGHWRAGELQKSVGGYLHGPQHWLRLLLRSVCLWWLELLKLCDGGATGSIQVSSGDKDKWLGWAGFICLIHSLCVMRRQQQVETCWVSLMSFLLEYHPVGGGCCLIPNEFNLQSI